MDCLKSENVTSAVKIVDLKKIVLIKKYRGWIISKPADMLSLAQTIGIIGTMVLTLYSRRSIRFHTLLYKLLL